jgi:hypothetical protein
MKNRAIKERRIWGVVFSISAGGVAAAAQAILGVIIGVDPPLIERLAVTSMATTGLMGCMHALMQVIRYWLSLGHENARDEFADNRAFRYMASSVASALCWLVATGLVMKYAANNQLSGVLWFVMWACAGYCLFMGSFKLWLTSALMLTESGEGERIPANEVSNT